MSSAEYDQKDVPAVNRDDAQVTGAMIQNDVVVADSLPRTVDPQVAGAILPDQIQTVAEYLSKPVMVASGSWGNALFATPLFSANIMTTMLGVPMWKEKLQGYYGIRFTTVLRLTLNGTPFHAGLLRLAYYPAPEMNPSKISQHTGDYSTFYQLPGVDAKPSDQSVVLRIPYASPLRFVELTSGSMVSPAQVQLRSLIPLTIGSTGATSITFNIWMSFEDVQLFGQSSAPIAQSDRPAIKPRVRNPKRNPTEQEKTPISDFLSHTASGVQSLGAIPSLAPFTGPTQWMLNAASQVAGALGWSKPSEDNQNSRVGKNLHWNLPNATGMDNAQKLSLFSDNKLTVIDDMAPGSQDELSVNFIKRQWGPFYQIYFSTSDTVGQQIWAHDLRPELFTISSGALRHYTPVSYLTKHFNLYRGSLEFKIIFAKTAFHAGQIQITFQPGPSASSYTLAETVRAYRLIVDLQEADEVCVRVPYIFPFDYFPREIPYGRIFIHVLTPLRAPETCAQGVYAMILARGGEDFEVASPALFTGGNPGDFVPVPNPFSEMLLEKQGGQTEVNGEICHTLGEDDPLNTVAFASHCQGEHISSLLSLLKRYEKLILPLTEDINKCILINPWTVTASGHRNYVNSARHSSIMSCFAFLRGGMRLRVASLKTSTRSTYFEFWNNGTAAEWYTELAFARNMATENPVTVSRATYDASGQGGAVTAPYQCKTRMSPVQYNWYTSLTTPSFYHPAGIVSLRNDDSQPQVFRCADDDFQLLFWVGVPVHYAP